MKTAFPSAAPFAPAPAAPARKIRVLLIEDTPADADLIRGLLALARPAEFKLVHTSTLARGLRRLAHGDIDVVLTDLNLPDSHGLETEGRVRAAAPLLPIIVLTGVDERAMALEAVHQGAQDYICKAEVDSRLLERAIHYAIERHGLLAELDRKYQKEHQLGQLKSQLVSVVSHEFANALSVIQCGLPSLAQSEGPGLSEDRAHLYQIIDKNVRSLKVTANNLLNMGRLEAGKFILHRRETDVVALMEENMKCLELLYQRKSLAVELEKPESPLSVSADPEALSLVLSNLLTNAIKYTPERGRVALGARPDPAQPGAVLIFVQDTGIGVSREEQEKIFTDFYRTENGKKVAEGCGVGLAFSKTILEAHGSALKVRSAPEKGARFYFTLPLWKSPRAADGVPA